MAFFDSVTFNIQKLFKPNFFTLHIGQRRYEWDQENVSEFIDDIIENTVSDFHYLIGNMVFTEVNDDGIDRLSIIEGQQRAITIFLILLYARNHYYNMGASGEQDYHMYSRYISDFAEDDDGNTLEIFKLKVLKNDNYIMEKLYKSKGKISEILQLSDLSTKSHKAIQDAIVTIETKLDSLTPSELKSFLKALKSRVEISVITTEDDSIAWTLFTNANVRGKRPGPDSTLKNLMFKSLNETDYDVYSEKWDDFINNLSSSNKNQNIEPIKFLRHYIMSTGKYVSGRGVYDYFDKIDKKGTMDKEDVKRKIDDFLEKSKKYKEYKYYSNNKSIESINLFRLSQAYIILLAATDLNDKEFKDICTILENISVVYSICGIRTNTLERVFVDASELLVKYKETKNNKLYIDAIDILKKSYIDYREQFIEKLKVYTMSTGHVSKQKTIYLLNKFSYLLNEEYFTKYSLEHIIPKKKEPHWNHIPFSDDEYKKAINKLGNLTLLVTGENQSIGNEPFSIKRIAYENSSNKLTSSIVKQLTENRGTPQLNKVLSECECPEFSVVDKNSWSMDDVDKRQIWMANLSKFIWFS